MPTSNSNGSLDGASYPTKQKVIEPTNLGSLINSPTVDLYKTTYHIKGGGIAKTGRTNMQF